MPRTNMSMYKHWGPRQGWSRRHRTLPTEPGVPSPPGTPVRRSMPSDPEPSPWGRKYFGFVQKKKKKPNNTIKKNNPPPSRVIQRPHVMCWHTNRELGDSRGRGTAPTPRAGTGWALRVTRPCLVPGMWRDGTLLPALLHPPRPGLPSLPGAASQIAEKSSSSPGWVRGPRHGQGDVAR